MTNLLAPAIQRTRRLTDEGRDTAARADERGPYARHARHAAFVVLCALSLISVPSGAAQYPGFMNNMVTDSFAVFTIPGAYQPFYLQKRADPTFRTGITRVSGDPGSQILTFPGETWGPVVRHVYSTQQPWNASQLLLALDSDGGSTSLVIVHGSNYVPILLECPQFDRYDWRWHPTLDHRNEMINVNQAGTELMWFDALYCLKTRSWPLPIVSNYGIGGGKGNPTPDGRYVAIGNDSQMVVVDMDPQPPHAPYPNLRIGPVFQIPPCSLDVAQPNAGQISHVAISPSGKFINIKYKALNRVGQSTCDSLCDAIRVFKVADDLTISVNNMADSSLRCGSFAARPNGWIYPLKHADMSVDPYDNNEDVLIGGRACPGATTGRVVKVRLRDGKVTVLTNPVNEAGYVHGSARNIERPGWFYVTYGGDPTEAGDRFYGEVVALKTDGSGEVQRFVHYHSAQLYYESQVQAVPSPDGKRILINSDWCANTLTPCPPQFRVANYVVDARTGVLLDTPEEPKLTKGLQLAPPSPNPTRRGLSLRISLPSARPTALEMFDVTGRRVEAHNVGVLGPGEHVLELDAERRLPNGVYLVTLTDGREHRSVKAVLLR